MAGPAAKVAATETGAKEGNPSVTHSTEAVGSTAWLGVTLADGAARSKQRATSDRVVLCNDCRLESGASRVPEGRRRTRSIDRAASDVWLHLRHKTNQRHARARQIGFAGEVDTTGLGVISALAALNVFSISGVTRLLLENSWLGVEPAGAHGAARCSADPGEDPPGSATWSWASAHTPVIHKATLPVQTRRLRQRDPG